MSDRELDGLLWDRARLLRQIAPVLRYVGHAHPRRAAVNQARAIQRKALRKALRMNAEAIAARCMELYPPPFKE